MAKKIRNLALANAVLNVPGKGLVRGSSQGVFLLPDAYAEELLLTEGWHEISRQAAPPARLLNPAVIARAAEAEKEAARVAAGEVPRVRADEQGAKAIAQVAEARARGRLPPSEPEEEELENDEELDEDEDDEELDDEGNELEEGDEDESDEGDPDQHTEEVDLSQLKRDELFEMAAKLRVKTVPNMTKAEVIEEIQKHAGKRA